MSDRFHILSYRVLSSGVPWNSPCTDKVQTVFGGQFLANLLTSELSLRSKMVLPLLSMRLKAIWTYGCSLSKWRPMMYCVSLIPILSMYSRATFAIYSLLSLEESCVEKLREICPATLLTRWFRFVWSMKLWMMWLTPSILTPELSMSSVPFFGSRM